MISIKDTALTNKTILLRCDLNVPMKNGEILDRNRIFASLDTIKYLLSVGAKIVICSHLGRPDGKFDANLSLLPVCKDLSKILDRDITFIPDLKSSEYIQSISQSGYGSVFMLENLRFYPEEEVGDDDFAKNLSTYADIFVNDAFACSHRKHSSIYTITKFLPALAGLNLLKEVQEIDRMLSENCENLMCIIGGSKISTKIKLLKNLVSKAKIIFLGGGMANTFFVARGVKVGLSLYEPDQVETAKNIIALCEKNGCKLVLPEDVVTSKSPLKAVGAKVVDFSLKSAVDPDDMIVDIGAKTLGLICAALEKSENVIWNGPVGIFENRPFDAGSIMVAREIASRTISGKIKSVVGGGDAVACANLSGMAENFSFVSTAGGAFLEYLEDGTLPGVECLKIQQNLT